MCKKIVNIIIRRYCEKTYLVDSNIWQRGNMKLTHHSSRHSARHMTNSCHLTHHPEDGSTKVLRNNGIVPQKYTASQSRRRPWLESSKPWRLEISYHENYGWLQRECRRIVGCESLVNTHWQAQQVRCNANASDVYISNLYRRTHSDDLPTSSPITGECLQSNDNLSIIAAFNTLSLLMYALYRVRQKTQRYLKFKNQLARYAALQYWQSSRTVLFGV
jgi:hypothetical protein